MNIFLEKSNNTNESYFIKIPNQSPNYYDRQYLSFPESHQAGIWYNTGVPERSLINWIIETFITNDTIFVDIGAHVGSYTWLVGKKAKHVHSFECNPQIFCYLATNVLLNNLENKVNLYQYGLGDIEQKLDYYIRSDDGGGNGCKILRDSDKNLTKIKINIRTLDSFELSNIGFIKIDVEGLEKEVIMGALQTLKNSNYPNILFESWKEPQNLRNELFNYIYSIGYKIISINDYPEMFLAEYNNKRYFEHFDRNNQTLFIENITKSYEFDGYQYSFNKSLCIKDSVEYYCERLHLNSRNCLLRTTKDKQYDICGLDIDAEDPRLILFNNKIYIIFNKHNEEAYGRKICISEYENFNPIELKIRNFTLGDTEKNWSPFVKDNNLYFVYNYDPLIILKYDNNSNDGTCDIVYQQIPLPIDTSTKYLRGGSNLIKYKDDLYISLCHSRLIINNKYYYLGFICLLDTNKWKIVYMSKPLMFKSKENLYNKLKDTDIIFDEHENLNVYIQYPISINYSDDENSYIITINVRDRFSLKYKLNTNIKFESDKEFTVNYWDNLIKDLSYNLIKNCSKF